MEYDIQDIYDKITSKKKFSPFYLLLRKYKEQILYVFFGGVTSIISIGTYSLFTEILSINILCSNIISWVLSVLFAFLTNRKWVFAVEQNKHSFATQLLSFYASRVLTLFAEEVILFVFITLMSFNAIIIKILAQIIVIISNYILSKIFVFKKQESFNE